MKWNPIGRQQNVCDRESRIVASGCEQSAGVKKAVNNGVKNGVKGPVNSTVKKGIEAAGTKEAMRRIFGVLRLVAAFFFQASW
jgi:hypothetical protein